MSGVIDRNVLVLNKHWLAVHVCSVRRAVSLVYQGLAHVVAEDYQLYDFDSWRELSDYVERHHDLIHTPSFRLPAPQVIVLNHYKRNPPRVVRFNRRNIFLRDKFQCQYCGCTPSRDNLTIDHVVPRSRGGRSTWQNVVLACTACNMKKGNRLPVECNMHLRTAPVRPTWLASLRVIPNEREKTVWQRFIDVAYWESNLRE